jgi:hypothetical protein
MKTFKEYLIIESISKSELIRIERYLDNIFEKVGIDIEFTKHFHDRLNDSRNKRDITKKELIDIFKEVYKRYSLEFVKYHNNFEAVLKDISTDINIPFVLKWNNTSKELELVSKTVMRKQDFKSSNKKYTVNTGN